MLAKECVVFLFFPKMIKYDLRNYAIRLTMCKIQNTQSNIQCFAILRRTKLNSGEQTHEIVFIHPKKKDVLPFQKSFFYQPVITVVNYRHANAPHKPNRSGGTRDRAKAPERAAISRKETEPGLTCQAASKRTVWACWKPRRLMENY